MVDHLSGRLTATPELHLHHRRQSKLNSQFFETCTLHLLIGNIVKIMTFSLIAMFHPYNVEKMNWSAMTNNTGVNPSLIFTKSGGGLGPDTHTLPLISNHQHYQKLWSTSNVQTISLKCLNLFPSLAVKRFQKTLQIPKSKNQQWYQELS